MDLVAVRFLSKVAPYNAGEVAGFPAEQAEDFIERGLAVPHDPDAPEPDSASVAGLLEGSVADVMHWVANTEDRELLVAACEAERVGEGRPTAMQAIVERIFQLRLHFPEAEAKDEAAARRPPPPSLVDDDPGPSDTEGLAGTITDVTERVLGLDDVGLLQRMHREETVGRGRAGVLRAVEDRLASLGRSPGDGFQRDDEPRPPAKVGGALRRLASGAAQRLVPSGGGEPPSPAEEERRALERRRRLAEEERRRQQRILDQALADGIEIWGFNDRPDDREPGSLH